MNTRQPPTDLWVIISKTGFGPYLKFDTEAAARLAFDGLRRNGYGTNLQLVAPTAGAGVIL